MGEHITIWQDKDGFHLVKGSDATREYVYPKYPSKAFYLEIVRAAVEGEGAKEE